jgi:hypothetical protein
VEVVQCYWIFLPVTSFAERTAFKAPIREETDDGAVTVEVIARRKACQLPAETD